MMMILRLAFNNIWRTKRRSIITALSVSLGVWLAVIFVGTREHTYARLIQTSVKMGLGHISLVPENFLDLPTPAKKLADAEAVAERLRAVDDVDKVLLRTMGNAVVNTAAGSTGVTYIGVDPAAESPAYNVYLDALTSGELSAEGCLIGEQLAARLKLGIGKKLVYTTTGADGQVINELARVSGIFSTGSSDLDSHVVVLPLAAMRAALGFGADEASYLAVYLKTPDALPAAFTAINQVAGSPGTEVLRWYESQQDIANFFTLDRAMYLILMFLVGIIIASGILNTMMMNVMERRREIGTMLAIGCSSATLFALMLTEALFVALIGCVIGIITVTPFYIYLNRVGVDLSHFINGRVEAGGVIVDLILKCELSPTSGLVILGILVLLTGLAAVYPAMKAAMTVPIETIRKV